MRSSRNMLMRGLLTLATSGAIALAAWPTIHLPTRAQQTNRIQQANDAIYAELPNFPKENTYVSGDGAEPGNTLIRRLLAYHIYVQGRPVQSRTDWKLTIADYLNLNEPMFAGAYPGADVLKTNPYRGDRAVIQRLSRQERNELLTAIFKAHNVDAEFQALELAAPVSAFSDDTKTSPETVPATENLPEIELQETTPKRPRPPARGTADQLL